MRLLERLIDPTKHLLLHHLTSRQHYPPASASPFFRANGRPPCGSVYDALVRTNFAGWTLEVTGLVERPLRLTLADLQQLPQQTQVTKHVCIQGWSALAAWTGVPIFTILDRCRILPQARYLVFHGFDDKARSEPQLRGGGCYYETIDLQLARQPQSLLAYAMNGQPLSVEHGAPLRLRVETQLGFKMVKWLRAIEVVADYQRIGGGQGGWREDHQHYSPEASI
jgi:DMSO/TMAO reductase YedYZ molybdopterin-dependent catalytic subunit